MFEELKKEIENCKYCEEKFGFEPHPIFWGKENSKIVQISQAPSNAVHNSGKTLKYECIKLVMKIFIIQIIFLLVL